MATRILVSRRTREGLPALIDGHFPQHLQRTICQHPGRSRKPPKGRAARSDEIDNEHGALPGQGISERVTERAVLRGPTSCRVDIRHRRLPDEMSHSAQPTARISRPIRQGLELALSCGEKIDQEYEVQVDRKAFKPSRPTTVSVLRFDPPNQNRDRRY